MYVLPVLFRPAIIVRSPSSSSASFTGPIFLNRNVAPGAGFGLCPIFIPDFLFVILATIRESTPKTTFQLAYVSFCNRSHQIPFPHRIS